MSATSEELAAQAEELQTSIAFFKVDAAGHKPAAKRPPVKAVAHKTAAVAKRRLSPAAAEPAHSVAAQQARVKGFALDLSMGGPDADDADFRESA
jgi:methyl-accepting chemotaxis protein